MKTSRKFKVPFYFVLFALSLFSLSCVLDPLLGLATGNTSGIRDGILARLIPSLTGGAIPDLKGMEAEGQLVTIDQLLQNVEGLTVRNGEDIGVAEVLKIDSDAAPVVKVSMPTNSNGSSLATDRMKARILRKPGNEGGDSGAVEMETLDPATLDATVERSLAESAVVLHAQGRIEEAIALYRKALAESPKDPGLHLNLAIALYQAGRYADSWDEVHAVRRLGGTVPAAFTRALSARLPDPADSE